MICAKCSKEYDETKYNSCPFCENRIDDGLSYHQSKKIKKVHVKIKTEPEDLFSKKTIPEMFPDNKYAWFVRFCNRKGIQYFGELSTLDFDDLLNEKGVGETKLEALVDQYHYWINYQDDDFQSENGFRAASIVNVNDQVYDLDSKILVAFGMKKSEYNKLKRKHIFKLGDFRKISAVDESFLTQINYQHVQKYLSMSLSEITEAYLRELANGKDFRMLELRSTGLTLQEISKKKGVTRERVRQIISSYLKKLGLVFNQVHSTLVRGSVIEEEDIYEFFGESAEAHLFEFWLINSKPYCYLDYLSLYSDKDWASTFEASIRYYLDTNLDEVIDLHSSLNDLNDYLDRQEESYVLDENAYRGFLNKNHYHVYGDNVFGSKPTYGLLCSLIIRDYYPNGIKLYDSDSLNQLRELVISKYGNVSMPNNNRSLSNGITKYTVQSGRGAVTAKENIFIDMNLLEELRNYIDSQPSSEIYYADLFARFEGKLKMLSNINNYYYLHGALKLFFPNDYIYQDRDYLSKKGSNGTTVGEFSDKLNEIIVREGRPLSKKELKNYYPGMTDIRLATAVSVSESLLVWSSNQYYSLDCLKYDEEDVSNINDCIEKLCETSGYCGSGLLFDYLSENNLAFLDKNQIDDSTSLFYLCSKLFNTKYGFKKPNIFLQKSVAEMDTEEVIEFLLGNPTGFLYQDFLEIANQQKWPESTRSFYFSELEKNFVRIGMDEYIHLSDFTFDKVTLTTIADSIGNNVRDGYLSLITFDDWSVFPQITYDWNSFLLKAIVEYHLDDYKIIEVKQKDRRYIKALIIRAEDPVDTYDKLLYRLVVQELGIGSYEENELINFCVLRGLTYKTIPKEILDNPNICFANNMWTFN